MPKAEIPANLTVDFSKVEERREGGKAAHVPPGDYLVRVVGVEKRAKKDDPTSHYLSWKLQITSPEKYAKAGFIYHITTLKEEGLWQLRNFIEDLGIKVPKSSVKLPLQTIVTKQLVLGVTLDDDTYNDKTKSKVQATFKKADFEATDTEDDEDEEATTEDDDTEEAITSDDDDLEELDVDDL